MQSTFYIASNSPPSFHFPWKPHKTHILTPSQTIPIKPNPSFKPLTLSNSLKTSFDYEFEEEKLDKADKPTTPARLPVVIRRSGSVSRYLWDGSELKLVCVDGNAFSLSLLCLDFEDGFRRLFRICGSALRNFFLPREVTGNYLEYVKWKFLHRVFSSALQVLATQAMFRAIGIGYSRSLPSAAALNWVLKDGLGRLSRCIYTASLASSFDTNLKRVRFSTSVLFSLSIGVELLTPAFPQYFLLLASIANIAKQISLACYLATGFQIVQKVTPERAAETEEKVKENGCSSFTDRARDHSHCARDSSDGARDWPPFDMAQNQPCSTLGSAGREGSLRPRSITLRPQHSCSRPPFVFKRKTACSICSLCPAMEASRPRLRRSRPR